jgi:hypothetical protein
MCKCFCQFQNCPIDLDGKVQKLVFADSLVYLTMGHICVNNKHVSGVPMWETSYLIGHNQIEMISSDEIYT